MNRRIPAGFAPALLGWFSAEKRDLPWRRSRDPYAIWVSEVMLQQTQVATVIPFYAKWLERFPGVAELARAPLEDVLGIWQGMGYYSRARTLHRAAKIVHEQHGGRLPRTREALREIPGFGPYTSGAVARLAFQERVPAVDGNVARVIARVLKLPGHSGDPKLRETVTRILEKAVPPDSPGDFNQALMELGATICRPLNPKCGQCPVAKKCLSRGKITAAKRPKKKLRTVLEYRWTALACRGRSGRLVFRKRPANGSGGGGLFGGLWELPTVESEFVPKGGRLLGEIEHRLTHRTIHLKVYEVMKLPKRKEWDLLDEPAKIPPVSTLTRKALRLVP